MGLPGCLERVLRAESRSQGTCLPGVMGGGAAASSALPPCSMLSRKFSTGDNQWDCYSDEEDWESLPFSFSPWGR